jgi:hypothetical protein
MDYAHFSGFLNCRRIWTFWDKNKLPILKEVLVMRKIRALFLGEFSLRNPFMPLNVLPRGHSARSNLPSGLGLSALPLKAQ